MNKRAVTLDLDGLKIVGRLYLPGGGGGAPYPTVCICHGIPAQKPAGHESGYPLFAERICRQGFAVFIFNFRGTGDSGGNLDMLGWTEDLKAVIDYLCALPEVDVSRLSLLGFSGGAAVSVCVASRDSRVAFVVACACPAEFTFFDKVDDPQSVVDYFRSLGTIRDKDFPPSAEEWFRGFKLVRPVEYVAGIAPRPLLLVHGNRDEVVNVSHARRLYDGAGEPRQLIIVDGVGHRLRHDEKAMALVIDWLKARSLK